jgi:hypothetical protein
VVALQPVEPGLRALEALGVGPLGDAQEVFEVAARDQLGLSGGGELLVGVLPERLEHPVAHGVVGAALGRHQRLVEEPGQVGRHAVERQRRRPADAFGRLEIEAAAEAGEPGEKHALGRLEQVVAPVDGRTQRLMPWHPAAGAPEEREARVEAASDLVGGEGGDTRGSELDREGQAVEPRTDPGDGLVVGLVEGETRVARRCPLDEEAHRVAAGGRLERQAPRGRQRQRRRAPDPLSGQPQRLAARGDHVEAGDSLHQHPDDARDLRNEVLAVVEDEQDALVLERRGQRLERRPVGRVRCLDSLERRLRDEVRRFDGR